MFSELTTDSLGEVLSSKPKVVVQYGATWCGNCKITKPKFKRMADAHPDVEFIYVDAEKLPGTRQFADVNNLPTFASFEGGVLVKQLQGNKIETIQDVVHAITNH